MTNQWFQNLGKRPALAVTLATSWLSLIGWLAYGWNLGNVGLVDETEPLFAEASRQMYLTGDWITPFFNGETRFDKPALIYWCQAIAYKIIGVNEWAVRLPSAIAAMGVLGLTLYVVQWQLAREDDLEHIERPSRRWLTAALAPAFMALSPEMIVWARAGVSDMLLTACIASSLLCFFLAYAQPNKPVVQIRWYIACYVLIAGAILTKGPVGIVLPGLIVGAFLLYLGNLRPVLREMRPLLGILIILVLSLPWYVLVIQRNGWTYINAFFGYHNLERFTSVVNRHSAPWYFYFIVVLLGFAPYSIYLPVAIANVKFWQRRHWRSQERSAQLGLFAFFWFICIFAFFSVSVTKLPSYVLPLMPAAAILVALLWGNLLKASSLTVSSLFWTGWINVAFLSTLAVALFYVPQLIGPDPSAPNFPQLLRQSNVALGGGVIWLLSAVIMAFLMIRRRRTWLMSVNLLGFAAFVIVSLMPTFLLMDRERQLPLRQLSAIVIEKRQPNEELVMVGFKKPSITFYTKHPVNYLGSNGEAVDYIKNQAANKVQPPSLLVLSQPTNFPEIGLQPRDYESLGTKGAYQLIRVPLKN
jgi:4-amino-4-deoxy-L-arabinose transferase-like glycosyltransferase